MNNQLNDETERVPEGFDGLHLEAPPDTVARFRKRASLLQGSRFVLERQFHGFWIVLNTFLKMIFKHVNIPIAAPDQEQGRRYRRALQSSKEGKQ